MLLQLRSFQLYPVIQVVWTEPTKVLQFFQRQERAGFAIRRDDIQPFAMEVLLASCSIHSKVQQWVDRK
ncbi:hypothetical protein C1141_19295, partial [Vibrio agarivorans]